MSQQPINLPPMAAFGSVVFAPQALLAIDASEYTSADSPDRCITVYIVGPHEIDLYGPNADAFKAWWEQITGQTRVQPVSNLKLT